jgi:hypothetical protein
MNYDQVPEQYVDLVSVLAERLVELVQAGLAVPPIEVVLPHQPGTSFVWDGTGEVCLVVDHPTTCPAETPHRASATDPSLLECGDAPRRAAF